VAARDARGAEIGSLKACQNRDGRASNVQFMILKSAARQAGNARRNFVHPDDNRLSQHSTSVENDQIRLAPIGSLLFWSGR